MMEVGRCGGGRGTLFFSLWHSLVKCWRSSPIYAQTHSRLQTVLASQPASQDPVHRPNLICSWACLSWMTIALGKLNGPKKSRSDCEFFKNRNEISVT